MGSCVSKNAVSNEECIASPHPLARRMWLVATSLDPKDIPEDLVGIDADGVKSALRNRGMETEHWALKIDPLSSSNTNKAAQPRIFDITVQAGRMANNVHTPDSIYWNAIIRRVCLGWTIWKDDEVTGAQTLLVQARPKYDGRTNNFQQLARLLAKHIEFLSPSVDVMQAPTSTHINASQMTLVSAAHTATSPSTDTDVQTAVKSAPASIYKTPKVPTPRACVVQNIKSPDAVSNVQCKSTHASDAGDKGSRSSARISQMPPHRSHALAPRSERQTNRQSAHEIMKRARTRSDASQAYLSQRATRQSVESQRQSRRRSEAPTDRLSEINNGRSAQNKSRSSHRDSVFSLGGGSAQGGAWIPAPMPSAAFMPMSGCGPMPTGLWPSGFGPHPTPPSATMMMMMMQQAGLMLPAARCFPPPTFTPSVAGVCMPSSSSAAVPVLAPPGRSFHSHASSVVPTPLESPRLPTKHIHNTATLKSTSHSRTCM